MFRNEGTGKVQEEGKCKKETKKGRKEKGKTAAAVRNEK
jgi:hypothetical protein